MKKVLRMVAMVMVMLTFSMTAFAAETGEVTGDVKVERSKSDVPQPRFPGTASIYSVKAYAADSALGQYYTDAYTYVTKFTGQFGNMSLNAATANLYHKQNCDSLYITVAIDNGKADMYEVYAGGELLAKGNFGPYYEGFLDTFTFVVPVKGNEASWKIVLYDREDAYHGVPLIGYISVD